MKPTIGRIVLYRTYDGRELPAIVNGVDPKHAGIINLRVFDDSTNTAGDHDYQENEQKNGVRALTYDEEVCCWFWPKRDDA